MASAELFLTFFHNFLGADKLCPFANSLQELKGFSVQTFHVTVGERQATRREATRSWRVENQVSWSPSNLDAHRCASTPEGHGQTLGASCQRKHMTFVFLCLLESV